MIGTEHQLNARKGPMTSKKAGNPPHNWEGQKKEGGGEERIRRTLHTREGAVKEDRFPHPGKPPHWWGDEPGCGGKF